jgi:hypothetical protein
MAKKILINNKIQTGKALKAAPFRKDIRKTTPHIHESYFEIIFLSRGSGTHSIDFCPVRGITSCYVFCEKGAGPSWDLKSEPEGYVLIIKKAFIDASLDKELKNLLVKVTRLSHLAMADTAVIEGIFSLLTQESAYEHEYSFQMSRRPA